MRVSGLHGIAMAYTCVLRQCVSSPRMACVQSLRKSNGSRLMPIIPALQLWHKSVGFILDNLLDSAYSDCPSPTG
jgi:hypothetical protein